jgi:hypothetical protein
MANRYTSVFTSGGKDTIRVEGNAVDVISVLLEELLFASCRVIHDTNSGIEVGNFAILHIV